jgi:hypothetical protein
VVGGTNDKQKSVRRAHTCFLVLSRCFRALLAVTTTPNVELRPKQNIKQTKKAKPKPRMKTEYKQARRPGTTRQTSTANPSAAQANPAIGLVSTGETKHRDDTSTASVPDNHESLNVKSNSMPICQNGACDPWDDRDRHPHAPLHLSDSRFHVPPDSILLHR